MGAVLYKRTTCSNEESGAISITLRKPRRCREDDCRAAMKRQRWQQAEVVTASTIQLPFKSDL